MSDFAELRDFINWYYPGFKCTLTDLIVVKITVINIVITIFKLPRGII